MRHTHDDMPVRVRLPSGRPRAAEPRRRRLRVAVSERELDTIRTRAGGRHISRYLRGCALLGSPEAAAAIDALSRAAGLGRGAMANLNQYSHRANLLLAAARGGAAGLDVQALEQEQRAMAALETDLRAWMTEMRSAVQALRGGVK